METSKKHLTIHFLSAAGPDDSSSGRSRNLFLQQSKVGRDAMKQAIEGAYRSLAPAYFWTIISQQSR